MTKTSPCKNYNSLKPIYYGTRMEVSDSVCSDWLRFAITGSDLQLLLNFTLPEEQESGIFFTSEY
jgi:hypothetical protein